MTIQNFFTSRDNNANANTYVGQQDRLWYNITQNALYVSDGVTPGGVPVGTGPGVDIVANNIAVNTISNDDSTEVKFLSDVTFDDEVSINGNLTIVGNIPAATTVKIGGVRAGPGANISNTGLLTIDTTGLPLSFGNFTANNNILTIVNSDEDMILATSGDAEIQLVGNIGFYKSNGLPPSANNRFFFAQDDGQLTILVPAEDPIAGGVEIIGSATGNFVDPGAAGTMLHLTGNPDIPCRVYQDTLGNYSSYVARRYNGNTASPTQVLAGQDVFRINTTAATDAGVGNVAMAQVSFTALEDQTTTAQGSSITFTVTPVGSPASSRVDVADITVANGVTATKFTTTGAVAATGNITGGNLLTTGIVSATGDITGGNLISGGDITLTGNIGNADAVQFDTGAAVTSNTEGLVYWNSSDKTLNINQQNGVTQQVGQEQYILALNETGSTIDNGTFVGFAGAGNNGTARIKIAPYLANGAQPSLYAVGIATESIANAAAGFVTTFGVVRDIDTTGNAVSQTWGVGNILYANPDVTGALTNVKPTAPDNVIPVAAVLKVDATEGEIFVRPTIEQKLSYGRFLCLTDQTANATNSARVVTFTNTDISNGITLGTPASRMVVDQSGFYQLNVMAQVAMEDTSADTLYMWLRKNGTDVDNSMHRVSVDETQNPFTTLTFVWTISLAASDYMEVYFAVGDTDIRLDASAATAFGPATAACTVDINQIQL